MAIIYFKENESEKAIESFEKAIRQKDTLPDQKNYNLYCYYWIGQIYYKLYNMDKAKIAFLEIAKDKYYKGYLNGIFEIDKLPRGVVGWDEIDRIIGK